MKTCLNNYLWHRALLKPCFHQVTITTLKDSYYNLCCWDGEAQRYQLASRSQQVSGPVLVGFSVWLLTVLFLQHLVREYFRSQSHTVRPPSPTSHTLTYLGLIPLNQVSYLVTYKSPLNTSRPKFHSRHWTAISRGAASLPAEELPQAGPCCASCCGEKTKVTQPESCLCLDPAQDHCYQAGHLVMIAPPTGLCQDRRVGLWTGQRGMAIPRTSARSYSLHMHS